MELTRVIVYGSTLNMAAIAASLKTAPHLEVTSLDPRLPAARQLLYELNPNVIAFDLLEPSAALDLELLRNRPGLLLIGVDLASDRLLILSSQASQASCMADLIDIIHRKGI